MRTDTDLGAELLALARCAIGAEFGMRERDVAPREALAAPGATFVTLRQEGALRGCIGSLEARRPLAADVRANAVAAAFRDPRFAPLVVHEFHATTIEVSLLSASVELAFADENDALRQLRPRIDGVILEAGRRRATFLPQVWEQLPEPREFLAALKRKAGLPEDYWGAQMRMARYTVTKFAERTAMAAGVAP
jgi:AmmeMemoRadiSam system protein A